MNIFSGNNEIVLNNYCKGSMVKLYCMNLVSQSTLAIVRQASPKCQARFRRENLMSRGHLPILVSEIRYAFLNLEI